MMTTAVKCRDSGGKTGEGGDSVTADEGAALGTETARLLFS